MIQKLLLFFIAGSILSTISYAGSVSSWDAYNDFSIVNNPNGAWAYGYSLNNSPAFAFVPFTNGGVIASHNTWGFPVAEYGSLELWTDPSIIVPLVSRNPTGVDMNGTWGNYAANCLNLHSGYGTVEGPMPVVQWTAQQTGAINVAGSFFASLNQNPTVDGYVIHNGSIIWTGGLSPDPYTQPFLLDLNVNAGDTLAFAIGNRGSHGADLTSFNATINAVPEPASIALLSSGLIGIAAATRRKRMK